MSADKMDKGYESGESNFLLLEPAADYLSLGINDLTYAIIGACMEVYNTMGRGFSEVLYKDALEDELSERGIKFTREKKYEINYKGKTLRHHYYADFVVEDRVILEIKAQQGVIETHYKQVINYLAVSKCEIGLIINFGEESLKYKRVI